MVSVLIADKHRDENLLGCSVAVSTGRRGLQYPSIPVIHSFAAGPESSGSNIQVVLVPKNLAHLKQTNNREGKLKKKKGLLLCCYQCVGGRGSKGPKLHWFVLKAELAIGLGATFP